MLTKALAAELADRGIRVNAVAPGATNTLFTGTSFADPEVFATSPTGSRSSAWASRRTWPRQSRSCSPTTPPTSRASNCPSTVAGSYADVGAGTNRAAARSFRRTRRLAVVKLRAVEDDRRYGFRPVERATRGAQTVSGDRASGVLQHRRRRAGEPGAGRRVSRVHRRVGGVGPGLRAGEAAGERARASVAALIAADPADLALIAS